MPSNKVIIGIHGLANKPTKSVLRKGWTDAIKEGMKKNHRAEHSFTFDMVYWADYLYKRPLHDDANFRFDELFNNEPYFEAKKSDLKRYDDGFMDDVRSGILSFVGLGVDGLKNRLGMDALADAVLSAFLKDLAYYYDEQQQLTYRASNGQRQRRGRARDVLQSDLRKALRRHKGKDILLVSHSMGTIIAYDTLRDLGRSRAAADRGIRVRDFVTLGSPLGLPHVRAKIMEERNYEQRAKGSTRDVRTPTIVTDRWANFADRRDPVSLDIHLNDDYETNDNGVRVTDDLVSNDYRKPAIDDDGHATRDPEGKANPHKSYGYLRTPEVSGHINDFLGG